MYCRLPSLVVVVIDVPTKPLVLWLVMILLGALGASVLAEQLNVDRHHMSGQRYHIVLSSVYCLLLLVGLFYAY